jgi:hypothetical protein
MYENFKTLSKSLEKLVRMDTPNSEIFLGNTADSTAFLVRRSRHGLQPKSNDADFHHLIFNLESYANSLFFGNPLHLSEALRYAFDVHNVIRCLGPGEAPVHFRVQDFGLGVTWEREETREERQQRLEYYLGK